MEKPTKRCLGIAKIEEIIRMPYYCKTHDMYTDNPTKLCKECLKRKQDDTLWCKLINDFD